jgi:hypothetical protein
VGKLPIFLQGSKVEELPWANYFHAGWLGLEQKNYLLKRIPRSARLYLQLFI